MKNGRNLLFKYLLVCLACVGYGVLVGFLSITSSEAPPGMTDNTSYQNFGIVTGSVVGVSTYAIAQIVYLIWKSRIKSGGVGLVYTVSITTGMVIGFLSSWIVHISADSYGLINARMNVIILGILESTVMGGLIPAVSLMLFSRI